VDVVFGSTDDTSYSMRGTSEEIAAEVRAFAEVGVTHLALAFGTTDAGEVVARAERFAREVAPLL
jgi:2-iminoacetate synthase ThiH